MVPAMVFFCLVSIAMGHARKAKKHSQMAVSPNGEVLIENLVRREANPVLDDRYLKLPANTGCYPSDWTWNNRGWKPSKFLYWSDILAELKKGICDANYKVNTGGPDLRIFMCSCGGEMLKVDEIFEFAGCGWGALQESKRSQACDAINNFQPTWDDDHPYRIGADNTNECPAGTVALSENECTRESWKHIGYPPYVRFRTGPVGNWPTGCSVYHYFHTGPQPKQVEGSIIQFNSHPTGEPARGVQPVCKVR